MSGAANGTPMTPEKRQEIAQGARAWLGTPYHHHGRIKGAGVDCAMLLAQVYEEAGVTEPVTVGYYAIDWHLHRGVELYLSHVVRHARQIEQAQAAAGDLVVVKFARTFSHGGIITGGAPGRFSVVHAYYNRGVIESRMDEEPLAGRPALYYTVGEVQP